MHVTQIIAHSFMPDFVYQPVHHPAHQLAYQPAHRLSTRLPIILPTSLPTACPTACPPLAHQIAHQLAHETATMSCVSTIKCLNKRFIDFFVSSISVTQCRFHYVSSVRDGPNGTFTSPQYPQPYPTSQVCKYTFHGQGKERVQLKFEMLDLHYPQGDPADPYE